MFKVKNSKVTGKLSLRSLRAGKAQNIIAVLAIVLTTVMFTSIFSIGASVIETFQLATMRQVGTRSHGGFKFINWEQYEKIAADPAVKDISYDVCIGLGENPELNKTPTDIRYTEEKAAEWSFSMPAEGTLPKERLDIMTSTAVLDALGVPHEIGAEVPLEFTANGEKHREIFRLCGWYEQDLVMNVNYAYLSKEYCDAMAPVWREGRAHDESNARSGAINPSLWFRSSWNIEKQMEELKARCGFGPEVNEGVNWAYMTDTVDMTTLLLIAGLLAVIMLSGYLIIYNVFYISVNNDIRFYGLLKTVGTTNRQLRRIVRRQALILALGGIPLGLALGYGVSALILPTVINLVDVGDRYVVSANPLIFVCGGLFSLLTVFVSLLRPCRLVSRISPVEAVRYSEAAPKRMKKHKNTRAVSPLSMAAANLGRTPAKNAAVVLSLFLSLVILNSTVTLVKGLDMDKYLQNSMVSDFMITDATLMSSYSPVQSFNSITPEARAELERLDGVTDSGCVYMREYRHSPDSGILDKAREIMDRAGDVNPIVLMGAGENLKNGVISSHIYGVDGLAVDKLDITDGSFDMEKFRGGNYVVASRITGSAAGGDVLYEPGDKVTLDCGGGAKEYEVMALGNIAYALGPQHGHGFDVNFMLPSEEFISLTGETGAMNLAFDVEPDKTDAIDAWLKNYCGSVNTTLGYRSKQFYIDEFSSTTNTFLLVGGLLSFILALIGILNFINAVVTSIQARKRELAVLQSVGMTGKQLKQMLAGEGAAYILATALLTLTVGSLLTYGMIFAIGNSVWYFSYRFTVAPILIVIPILFVFAVIIPVISYMQMCRHSVVERLREVNF